MGPDGIGGAPLHAPGAMDHRGARACHRHHGDLLQSSGRRLARRAQPAGRAMSPVLQVRDYSLDYLTRGRAQRVLQDVSLAIEAGEVLGLVGESGSGKTSLAWAIMRHLPGNG